MVSSQRPRVRVKMTAKKKGFWKRWFKGLFHWEDELKSNVDGFVGEWGIVERETSLLQTGIVVVNGTRWIAKSSVALPEGTEVEVIGVVGATLEVKAIKKEVQGE